MDQIVGFYRNIIGISTNPRPLCLQFSLPSTEPSVISLAQYIAKLAYLAMLFIPHCWQLKISNISKHVNSDKNGTEDVRFRSLDGGVYVSASPLLCRFITAEDNLYCE